MRVVVTGGPAFVDSHTFAEFVRHGHEVRLLLRDRYEATQALRQVLNRALAWKLIEENPAKRA